MNSVAVAVARQARLVMVRVVQVAAVTPQITALLELVPPTREAVAEDAPIQPLLPLVLAAQEP
jgi:hypothetical protein